MYAGSFSEVSNRASWNDCIELRDQETDEPIDFSDAQEIVVQVLSQLYDNYYRYGYGYGFGGYVGSPMLTATLSGGKIAIIQTGVFQFSFTRAEMNTLPGGIYSVGVTIVKDDETCELIIGTVPVREGIVTIQAGAN